MSVSDDAEIRDYAVVLMCHIYHVTEGRRPESVGTLTSDCEAVGVPMTKPEILRRGEAGLKVAAGVIGIGAHPADRIAQWLRDTHPEAAYIADEIARGDYRA